jgi:carbonic anhydrase
MSLTLMGATSEKSVMKIVFLCVALACSLSLLASERHPEGGERSPAGQATALERNTAGKGFGPQSPRDLSLRAGSNEVQFSLAPDHRKMNLCNIHFHKGAEHRGPHFSKPANAGGHPAGGFVHSAPLGLDESEPLSEEVCQGGHAGLQSGDTLELHYVFTSAQVRPGPGLAACMSEAARNPQLRVEAQVLVLVNDDGAADFRALAQTALLGGHHQAPNMPRDTGVPIVYRGSTTGPDYSETGSPFQVTWSVMPRVKKVSIRSLGEWCKANVFDEQHAHRVRPLVTPEQLLSRIR